MISDQNTEKTHNDSLWELAFNTIQELETANGILASGKEEIYGCIFGRDSLITCLKLIKIYHRTGDVYFLNLAKKVLKTLAELQGKEHNIESGEQPGKCIHEYRPNNHEHLTKSLSTPWYVYPDNVMRNYDTVDGTPLFLIAAYRFYQASKDEEFIQEILPNINLALNWISLYGDSNNDGFIDYAFSSERKFGGLKVQSWMDSEESVFHADGQSTVYPIAPVEVQAYTYLALKLWANYFAERQSALSSHLQDSAADLKEKFNEKFVMEDQYGTFLAAAIDGNGKAMEVVRSSMGHCLWACLNKDQDGVSDCILDDEYIPALVHRIMSPDLFESQAGIRTLSNLSKKYGPHTYHNGSIWPHDTSMVSEGMDYFGYNSEANLVRTAMLSAITHFNTPIELFAFSDVFEDYKSDIGQLACKKQAWSAASILKDVSALSIDPKFHDI